MNRFATILSVVPDDQKPEVRILVVYVLENPPMSTPEEITKIAEKDGTRFVIAALRHRDEDLEAMLLGAAEVWLKRKLEQSGARDFVRLATEH